MNACRVLPHEVGDGPTNMARDEALLDSVAADPTAAIVRTYSWSIPTLSLGYFQPWSAVEADPRWADQAVVRRATGGGALWHDHEVTYAAIVPAGHPLARPSTALYQAIHRAIAAHLQTLGVRAERRGPDPSTQEADRPRPFLCFLDRDDDDVVVGTVKLVGSAQRRRAGAVLQHGSLLLRRSAVTPELAGLSDLIPSPDPTDGGFSAALAVTQWARVLQEVLPVVIGGAVVGRNFTAWERDRADTLRRDVYAAPNWTRRR